MIVSCFVEYNETPKAYKIYIPTQQIILRSLDVKFDEDVWYSISQVSPSINKGSREIVIPYISNPKVEKESMRINHYAHPLL